jgi:hypothetical protein
MRPGSTTSLLNQKGQASSANTPILHPPKKAKANFSAGKIMANVFWDSKGIIHLDFFTSQKTIDAQYYSTLLNAKVKPAIRSKRRTRQDSVFFLQDNAPPHTAALTMATPPKLKWDVLPHTSYSPDLAPSDYHLFTLHVLYFIIFLFMLCISYVEVRTEPETFLTSHLFNCQDYLQYSSC